MTESRSSRPLSRRDLLGQAAGAAALLGVTGTAAAEESKSVQRVATKGRIRQSVVHWCFADHWDIEQMARITSGLGCQSIELAKPKDWPVLKKHGLTCAIVSIDMAPDPPFVKGFNNPEYWPKVIQETKKSIDAAAEFGAPNVIAFTGMREDIPDDVGLANCVKGMKKIIGYAEKKKVNLCLENLNSRVKSHPMKGHPGYQGDHTDYCAEIVKQVGSPRMKLLFDIYHAQIMDGDLIRRIRQHHDLIGHVHTAGNPGRGELDADQEINYPALMKTLVEVGYEGYVGQEFIPTRDPLAGLKEAVAVCDV